MQEKKVGVDFDLQERAEKLAKQGNWKQAMELFSRCVDQHTAELALINSVQEGLSSKLEMQGIYDLVGDKLRDTFNAQVVMISQYDPYLDKIYHHYAIENGEHLHIQDWQPLDSSRGRIVSTGKPYLINADEILKVLSAGTMKVVPGTQVPKTWLGVPLMVGGEVRGIVSLQNLDRENAFSKSDITLLSTLTNSMSLSLENARLFNETERLLNLIKNEMVMARETQESILPTEVPGCTGYDIFPFINPARMVGGDFYDLIQLEGERLILVIGDVSDKGLPAALFMALTFSLLRSETEHSEDPCKILENVNNYLLKMNALGMYVTLLYGILDCRSGKFTYSRAGHLPPIILDNGGKSIDVKVRDGQALGVLENPNLNQQEVIIPPGGVLLLFSDGLNETMNANGEEFGIDRVRKELVLLRHLDAKNICKGLWKAASSYCGDAGSQDDFTVLVTKRDPE